MDSDTARFREWGRVVAYAAAILVVSPFTAELLVEAWSDRGLPYLVIRWATDTAGVNFDLGVISPIGFVLVLLILFSLDEYKRVQALLLLLGSIGFVLNLVRMGTWTELIDWNQYWWGLFVGGIIGLVGVGGAKLPSRGRWEFPGAARWIYRVTTLVIVVGIIEYHLTYGDGIGVQRWDLHVSLPVSFLLLIAVAEFVRYSNTKEVVVIGGGDRTESSFLGGIFAEARDRFDGVPLDADGDDSGAVFLNKAAAATEVDKLPERGEIETVAFRYTPGGLFRRQIVITANRYDPPTERDIEILRDRNSLEKKVLVRIQRFLGKRLAVLIPRIVRNAVTPDSDKLTDRLETADSILLIAPVSDFVDEDMIRDGDLDDWRTPIDDTPPRYLSIYHDICDLYATDDRDAVIVATEASLAMRLYEEREHRYPSFNDTAFQTFLTDTVMTADKPDEGPSPHVVMPVDRQLEEDDGTAIGFDNLLRRIA